LESRVRWGSCLSPALDGRCYRSPPHEAVAGLRQQVLDVPSPWTYLCPGRRSFLTSSMGCGGSDPNLPFLWERAAHRKCISVTLGHAQKGSAAAGGPSNLCLLGQVGELEMLGGSMRRPLGYKSQLLSFIIDKG
jgi:hypothetical protein